MIGLDTTFAVFVSPSISYADDLLVHHYTKTTVEKTEILTAHIPQLSRFEVEQKSTSRL